MATGKYLDNGETELSTRSKTTFLTRNFINVNSSGLVTSLKLTRVGCVCEKNAFSEIGVKTRNINEGVLKKI